MSADRSPAQFQLPDQRFQVRPAILLLLLTALCSCSAIKSVQATAESLKATAERLGKSVEEIQAEADVNKDGKVSGQEWMQYLLATLGLSGLGGAGLLAKRNASSNERKARMEMKLEHLERAVEKSGTA